jgi:hypothetical protein
MARCEAYRRIFARYDWPWPTQPQYATAERETHGLHPGRPRQRSYDRNYSDRELLAPHRRLLPAARRKHAPGGRHDRSTRWPDAAARSSSRPQSALTVAARGPPSAHGCCWPGACCCLGAPAGSSTTSSSGSPPGSVGDVVLKLREDVFAPPSATTCPSTTNTLRARSSAGHVRHAGLLRRRHPDHQPAQPGACWWCAVRPGSSASTCWLTLLLLAMAPVAVGHGAQLPAHRPPGHAARAPGDGQDQRPDPGVHQRHHGGQELPPGARHLCHFRANNRQAYRVGLRRGLTLNTIFPIMGMASGLGHAALVYAGGLATRGRWSAPATGISSCRRWVSSGGRC